MSMYGHYPWSKPVPCSCMTGDGGSGGEGLTPQDVKSIIEEYLANYPRTEDVNTLLVNYLRKEDVATYLSAYATKAEVQALFVNTASLNDVVSRIAEHAKLIGFGQLGHVNAVRRTPDMSQLVGIDAFGGLWTAPTGGTALNPVDKTADMVVPVGKSADGRLWTTGGESPETLTDGRYYDYQFDIRGNTDEDLSQKINDAINTISQSGGGLFQFGAGVYKVKNILLRSNVFIKGLGENVTKFLYADSDYTSENACFYTNGTAEHFGLSSCTVQGHPDVDSGGGGISEFMQYIAQHGDMGQVDAFSGIHLYARPNWGYHWGYFDHLFINGFGSAGFWVDHKGYGGQDIPNASAFAVFCDGVQVERCGVGVIFNGTDCFFRNSYIENSVYDGFLSGGSNNTIINLKCIWNGVKLYYQNDDKSPFVESSRIWAYSGDWQSEGYPTSAFMLHGKANKVLAIETQDNFCDGVKISGYGQIINCMLCDGDGCIVGKGKKTNAIGFFLKNDYHTVHGLCISNYKERSVGKLLDTAIALYYVKDVDIQYKIRKNDATVCDTDITIGQNRGNVTVNYQTVS